MAVDEAKLARDPLWLSTRFALRTIVVQSATFLESSKCVTEQVWHADQLPGCL